MKTKTSLAIMALIVSSIPMLYAQATTIPNPDKNYQINGAGATFPYPLIDLWRVEYNKLYPNVNLNYQSIGSGGGVKQHTEKTVNFGASDAPLKQAESDLAPGTLHIPEAIGGVVVVYNLPEIKEKGLKLTGEIIADIYLGKITKWNDPKITELNPNAKLPKQDIIPARRSDGSGTTFVFTDYLAKVSPEFNTVIGVGKSVPWQAGIAGAGNEGVSGIVKSSPYTIGYVELAYAFQTGLPYAFIQNADKTGFVEPSIDTISSAAAGAHLPESDGDWSAVSITNAPGKNSYPIASFTYLLVYKNIGQVTKSLDEAQTVVHMINWMITDGQKFSSQLLYVPLPNSVTAIGQRGLSMVQYDNQQVLDLGVSSKPTQTSPNIPAWIKGNAKWWSEGQIDDGTFLQGIQYLIKNGIMKVPSTSQSGSSDTGKVPAWIKNNAGWWADGQIDDSTFVQGIQYLIKEGYIRV